MPPAPDEFTPPRDADGTPIEGDECDMDDDDLRILREMTEGRES